MSARSCNTDRPVALCRYGLGLRTMAVAVVAGVGFLSPVQAAAPLSFEYLRPVGEAELARLRGGFVLPNGLVVHVSLAFHTTVSHANGGGVPFVDENFTFGEEVFREGGVRYTVTVEPADGTPAVEITPTLTDGIAGVMNVIQNNANGIAIQNTTTLNVDMFNATISQHLFQAHSFTMRMRTIGALGL